METFFFCWGLVILNNSCDKLSEYSTREIRFSHVTQETFFIFIIPSKAGFLSCTFSVQGSDYDRVFLDTVLLLLPSLSNVVWVMGKRKTIVLETPEIGESPSTTDF